MTKPIYILLSFLISGNIFCQNSIINDSDIPKLDSIIKYLEKNYNQIETPNFYSLPQTSASYFEIENNQNHSISSEYYNIKRIYSSKQKIKIYYSAYQETWSKNKDATIIRGFYLNNELESKAIPKKFSDWISYTDIIVKPETSIFFDNDEKTVE